MIHKSFRGGCICIVYLCRNAVYTENPYMCTWSTIDLSYNDIQEENILITTLTSVCVTPNRNGVDNIRNTSCMRK